MTTERQAPTWLARRVTAVYATVATSWILVTDLILFETEGVEKKVELLSIAKGLLFVAFTSLVLYRLLRRAESRLAREAELRGAAVTQLARMTKLEALGRFASSVAHDFNNILTAILGYVELARPLTRELTGVRSAAERGRALTRQLLEFGHSETLTGEPINVAEVLEELEPLLRSLLGASVRVNLHTEHAGARVDRTQLEMGIVNLAANARDAMPRGGTFSISCRTVAPGPGRQPVARVVVADTGTGIEPELVGRIFDPYVTSKEGGVGLGLFSINAYVTRIGGTIEVDSSLGAGTTFTIDLPASSDPGDLPGRDRLAPTSPAATRGTVLVVDDDEVVLALATRILSPAGYTVKQASSADEALKIASTPGLELDVLITDVVMPGLQGDRLAATLIDERRVATAVLMSDASTESAVAPPPNVRFIAKPFTPDALLSVVEEALTATGQRDR